jgi:N-dimethylarginine dimethylaminohydrolase
MKKNKIEQMEEYPKNLNFAEINRPVYLMNPPLGYHAKVADNEYMEHLKLEDRIVDKHYALEEWFYLYKFLAKDALVYLMPTPNENLQDLTYVSNLGVVLENLNVAIVSDFTAKPRLGETKWGEMFFKMMGFDTYVSPYKFEGDAELKWIKDNIYVGAYGIRSDIRIYDWMEEKFNIKVIRVKPQNPWMYHLDVNFLPVTYTDALCCCESFTKQEIKELEKYVTLYDVPTKYAEIGGTSGLRHKKHYITGTCIENEIKGTEDYRKEIAKNEYVEKICNKIGINLYWVNVDEFFKGGGDLSCLILQINRKSFGYKL